MQKSLNGVTKSVPFLFLHGVLVDGAPTNRSSSSPPALPPTTSAYASSFHPSKSTTPPSEPSPSLPPFQTSSCSHLRTILLREHIALVHAHATPSSLSPAR